MMKPSSWISSLVPVPLLKPFLRGMPLIMAVVGTYLVQLPETIDPAKVLEDGTKINSIAQASRERVRRAIATVPAYVDEGFRAFRLTTTNIRR